MTNFNLGNRSDGGHGLFKGMTKKKAKADKKKVRSPIHVSEHGRYQVKSGLLAGKFIARAFAKPPTKTRGLIAEASGPTEEAAISALHEVIDTRENQRIEGRRKDPDTGMAVPSVDEYAEALGQAAFSRTQGAILTALSVADADGLTEAQLANAAGYKSLASVNRSLASADRLISNYLSSDGNSKVQLAAEVGGSNHVIRREPHDVADPVFWMIYPELRDAVRAIL